MEISKRYIKKFWGIALAVSGLVTTVFIGFATQDTNGMISYYCTVGNSFFGLQLQIYALCPVYVTISSIVVAMSVILLFLLVIAVLIDIFIIIFGSLANKKESNNNSRRVTTQGITDQLQELPPILGRFSYHLDEAIKGKNISGSGVRFLTKAKLLPPFLGFESSVIHPEYEKRLTEHFMANEFVEKNKTVIKGGKIYQCKERETEKKIAEHIYGDEKFAEKLLDANKGGYPFSTGQMINLPFIDTSGLLGLSSEEIGKKYDVSRDDWINPTLQAIIQQYFLVDDEALWLLETTYDAAQKALK